MTSPGCTVLLKPEKENEAKKLPCPLHGCKRVYTDMNALQSHIRDHEIPAQSLPGKVFLCSSTGCSGSFPSMQKLMEHMRQHHKSNIYFQCESCRTKLRSYRGLLAHLHTCSKVPRLKSKTAEQTPAPASAVGEQNTAPQVVDQQPPKLESMSTPQPVSTQIRNPDGSLPAFTPHLGSAEPPVLGPPMLPLFENPLTQLRESAPQILLGIDDSNLPPSLNSAVLKVSVDPPSVQTQQQTLSRSVVGLHPVPGPAVLSSPGSSAIWKKNQGMSCSRRVLWEHTRGRYTCIQCGHITTNRKAMTQHINGLHSGTKAAGETGSSATNT